MKKLSKSLLSLVLSLSLIGGSSSIAFAHGDEQEKTGLKQAELNYQEQEQQKQQADKQEEDLIQENEKIKEQQKQQADKQEEGSDKIKTNFTEEQKSQINSELDQLKAIRKQSEQLNSQLGYAQKSLRERIHTLFDNKDLTDGQVKQLVETIKPQLATLKEKITNLKTLREDQNRGYENLRAKIKSSDFDGAVTAIKNSQMKAQSLLDSKQIVLDALNSITI